MTMMKMKAAKKVAPAAAAPRRRCHVLAARPGTCVFILVRQMSRSAACPAPRRKKRSAQTIYDAATREVLQIDFPSREAADAAEKKQIPRAKFAFGMTVRAFVRSLSNERVEWTSSGMNSCKKSSRGDYFRRNRLEISPETERNTSTASAPIMQKAIIILSGGARLPDGIGIPGASRACRISLAFSMRERLAGRTSCR
jgi:hypothetical protein